MKDIPKRRKMVKQRMQQDNMINNDKSNNSRGARSKGEAHLKCILFTHIGKSFHTLMSMFKIFQNHQETYFV